VTRIGISESVFTNSSTGGGVNCSSAGPSVICTIRNSAIINNAGTEMTGGGAQVLLTRSTIMGNGSSWVGSVQSYGDNEIDFNMDANPTPPSVAHK
jgi:hypothetical protein